MSRAPRSGRPRDPEVDRRIVEATRALIREGGRAAVSVAKVAERAGVGRPSVYRRFPDATALTLGVLYTDLQERVVDSLPDLVRDEPILDQLCAVVRPIMAYYLEDPPLSALLLQLAVFGGPEGGGALERQVFEFLDVISGLIGAARARGELRPDLDPQVTSLAFFALYFTTAIGAVRGQYRTVDEALAVFRAMMAQQLGLLAPSTVAGG